MAEWQFGAILWGIGLVLADQAGNHRRASEPWLFAACEALLFVVIGAWLFGFYVLDAVL